MGFRVGGVDKFSYCHFDAYPDGLGNDICEALRISDIDCISSQIKALRVVDGRTRPSDQDVVSLSEFTDLSVSDMETSDWYCLLRKTQGDMLRTLRAGVIVDSSAFINDSLFCEWAYVVNIDVGKLEVYKGFQRSKHARGRYCDNVPVHKEYFPCALVAEFELGNLPESLSESLQQCGE